LACEFGICDADAPAHFEMWDVEISRNPTQNLAVACGGVGTSCGMVFSSTDDGATWSKESHECQAAGLPGGIDCSLAADTAHLYHEPPPPVGTPPPAWFTHTFRHQDLSTIYGIAIFSADNSIIGSGYAGQLVRRNPETGLWQDRSSFNARIHEVDNAVTMP